MLKYTSKIWLTSVVTAPIVMLLLYKLSGEGDFEVAEFYGWMLFYGAILSLPAALIFWPCTKLLIKSTKLNSQALKLVFSILAASCIYLLFTLFKLINDFTIPMSAYLITTIAGVWFYTLNYPEKR